jgi:hypothetical protein
MKSVKILALVCASLLSANAFAAPAKKKVPAKSYESYSRPAASAGGHSMAGCGLGSMVVEDSSKWAQVGAAFLNGTGMQTFGITFGTSNCTEDGVAEASREKDAFVEANYADLRHDVSVGSGAYLSSLASLYGCKDEAALSFGAAIQKHQDKVLGASAAEASQVIEEVVASEEASCQG